MKGGGGPKVEQEWSEDDESLVAAFERCELANEAFRHRDHVRLTWLYLGCEPLPRAIDRFVSGLKRFYREETLASELAKRSFVFPD